MASAPGLKRSLRLWDLIIIGMVIIQPIAPTGIYGVVSNKSGGHVVTTILIALVAMLFTAISYGKMARAYPSAGSAYTYVAEEIHPGLGYLTGWAMVMVYVVNPLICTAICSKLTQNIVPGIPYFLLAIVYAGGFTMVNLRGNKTSARVNEVMASIMAVVVVIFFVYVIRFVWQSHNHASSFFTGPFYNPETFSWGSLFRGTSIAVLTYIGFDAVSTLSEEVDNPRRNVMLATVIICALTGFLSALEVYGAQLVWGAKPFPEAQVESAFPLVARQAGGLFLFHLMNATILIANIGSGMGSQLAAGRLLFGMGRNDALPRKFFGAIQAKRQIPANGIMAVGAFALVGAVLLELLRGYTGGGAFEVGAEALTFGAFVSFMGVNAASFVRYGVRVPQKNLSSILIPLLGFTICAFMLWNLSVAAKIVGTVWLTLGLSYGAWKTRGFRQVAEFGVAD